MSDIRVEGLEKLMKQLKDIREDSDAVVEKGLLRGAERVCAAAKLRCPVSSGALRNSIHTEGILALAGRGGQLAHLARAGGAAVSPPCCGGAERKRYKGRER